MVDLFATTDPSIDDDFELDVETVQEHRDLIRRHDTIMARTKRPLQNYDDLYEGEMPLKYMAPAVAAQFGDRITQLVLNVADLVVESYENRLDIDGIRLDPRADADDAEAETWDELDMSLVQQQVHLESLALGRSFTCVGVGDDDQPVVTAESPFQMTTILDPLRQTKSAVKRWKADDGRTNMRTLYLPNETLHWVQSGRSWDLTGEFEVDDHGLGRVPVFTFLNRARLLQGLGSPEFKKIIPIYEALNKMGTDMMVGGEFHALPRRWATNVDPDQFEDEEGKRLSPLEQIIGAMWSVPGEPGGAPVTVGQFAASDLTNFHNSIKMLFQMAGHIMGLPAAFTSFASDNPAAEGAIKAGEIQLIKGSERKQVTLSPSWRRTWQTVMQVRSGGVMPKEAKRLKIMWRDPSTPTIAQKADAVSKLVATTNKQGVPVVPIGAARELMGFSAAQRDSMAEEDRVALRAGTAAIRDAFSAPEFLAAP